VYVRAVSLVAMLQSAARAAESTSQQAPGLGLELAGLASRLQAEHLVYSVVFQAEIEATQGLPAPQVREASFSVAVSEWADQESLLELLDDRAEPDAADETVPS